MITKSNKWIMSAYKNVRKILIIEPFLTVSKSCPWYIVPLTNAAAAAAAAAKSLQSCPTLCDSIDGSPPGSPVPGILQARTLDWVAISFSNAWKWKVKVKSLSYVWLFETPWTAAYQASLSMGFARQEYGSGLPLPSLWMLTEHCKMRKVLLQKWDPVSY